MKKPLALIIMDGYGRNDSDYGNAIAAANTSIWIVFLPWAQKPISVRLEWTLVCPMDRWVTQKWGIPISVQAASFTRN